MKVSKIYLFYLVFFLFLGSPLLSFGQGINVDFGKNRVQYHDFTWSFYESDNFVTYYYQGGQDLGKYVVQVAEQELPSLEKLLDYKLSSRMEILVYNDISDLNQSNIGTGLDLNTNVGGLTKIIGNKIFIYFNGNHSDLRRQVREGIAQVLLNNMIFGGSLQEVLQNAVLLNLPEWFVSGLISYAGERWNTKYDSRLKDGILSGRYKKFNKLSGIDAKIAGHSFWYFIERRNGREAVPNLLYLTRINRSLENGFLFVLGYTYQEAIREWFEFYEKRYKSNDFTGNMPLDTFKVKRKNYWWYGDRDISDAKISPNGRYIAYITENLGRKKVYLQDLEEGKTKKLLKVGFKTKEIKTDENYPMIAWDPTGRKLLMIYEKRDVIRMRLYNVEEKKNELESNLVKFQRIFNISFTDNPNEIVMSAMNRGQSDIFKMNILSQRVTQITNDFYDDLNADYVKLGDRKGIIFSSNRRSNILSRETFDTVKPLLHFDLYFFNESSTESNQLLEITQTPNINEWQPVQMDTAHFGYLSEQNGVYNRFAGYIDTVFSHFEYTFYYRDSIRMYDGREFDVEQYKLVNDTFIDSMKVNRMVRDTAYTFARTNRSYNILNHDILRKQDKVLETYYLDGDYQFYLSPIKKPIVAANAPFLEKTKYARERTEWIMARQYRKTEPKKKVPDPGFSFQTIYETEDTTLTLSDLKKNEEEETFVASQVLPYRVKFSTDYVISQLDNSIIINQYQNFIGNGPIYQQQNLSGLMTLSISDLMEDYRFVGGFRVPTNFGGSEYFIKFEDRKHLIDKQYMVYRQANRTAYSVPGILPNQVVEAKQTTTLYEAKFTYPFDVTRSLRGTAGIRNYKINFLARDTFSLELPSYSEQWASLKLEYVFDNTFQVMTNILNGTRYKVYYEMHKAFAFNIEPDISLDFAKGFMNIVGFDFRHYQKLHRQIIWANRLAGATSFGSQKLIYYMGGVDNWLGAKFNDQIDVNRENNYAFQTIATNMRGFRQNIRNGNSYMVLNSELRIPVFSYLINKPIRSEFLRNFQIVGFGDVGTAWEGISPYSEENPFNTTELVRGPVRVKAQYFRNPIVGGYGVGARSVLFGYFVRLDMAWGVDSGEVQEPIWYFSLSTDF